MNRMMTNLFFGLLTLLTASCGDIGDNAGEPYVRQTGSPVNGVRIAWDYSSMQRLAPQNGRALTYAGYSRVKRMSDGRLCCVYEAQGSVEYITSTDDGASWSSPTVVFERFATTNNGNSTTVNITNGEFIELANGDWVMGCNYRPAQGGIFPFSIAIRRSKDKGATWLPAQVLYEAGNTFDNGCWEPAFLQLPSGELQVYFANEGPFTASTEQNISMKWSNDNGETWNEAVKTVCFRAGRRDGMPVPILLDNEIVMSIEDNNIGQFKPYIVRTSVADNWSAPVLANSPNRESALIIPLADPIYAGAPYIVRLPSGEVIVSYQSSENRNSPNEVRSVLTVAISDKAGRNFEKVTRPFDVPIDKEAMWNALAMWDNQTVVASTSTNFKSANSEVWMIKGHVIPEIAAEKSTITNDGNLIAAEWGTSFPIFVGQKGETRLRAAISHDDANVYLAASVTDPSVYADSKDALKADGVSFLMDANNSCLLSPDEGIYKVWCNRLGVCKFYEGSKGVWKELKSSAIKASVLPRENNAGYDIELTVPLAAIEKNNNEAIRLGVGLRALSAGGAGYDEFLVNATESSANTWCLIEMK